MAARDTRSEARAVQREVQGQLGGAGRVELAFEMSEQARQISIAGMRSRDPELSQAAARSRLLRRILGDDLHRAAYGHRAS